MTISDWMPTLKTVFETVIAQAATDGVINTPRSGLAGQVHTFDELPATIAVFPTFFLRPQSGTQIYSQGGPNIAHTNVIATLFVARQVIAEAEAMAVPFIAIVRDKLAANFTLSGSVAHVEPLPPPTNWYEGPTGLLYADKVHLGINFFLDVKERETVTVTV